MNAPPESVTIGVLAERAGVRHEDNAIIVQRCAMTRGHACLNQVRY
jgi:hypothetical protein